MCIRDSGRRHDHVEELFGQVVRVVLTLTDVPALKGAREQQRERQNTPGQRSGHFARQKPEIRLGVEYVHRASMCATSDRVRRSLANRGSRIAASLPASIWNDAFLSRL